MFCGGGAQFDNSGFKVLRQTEAEEWRRFIVDWKAGEIILALRHNTSRAMVQEALKELGGLATLADERPWVFDYIRLTPKRGYLR